jgi:DNA-binding transcriptional MerR regulator
MNRGEFEARLLRDPQLRRRMEMLEEAAERVRRAQQELSTAAVLRDFGIAALANEGVPLAAIARLVDLTPQRLGVIVQAVTDRVTEEGLDLDELVAELRASEGVVNELPAKLGRAETSR